MAANRGIGVGIGRFTAQWWTIGSERLGGLALTMLAGLVALIVAALFAGAALYVNVAEQPARLALNDQAMLCEWKPSYKRGFAMQAPLAIVGCVLGLVAWWQTPESGFLIGAIAMIANWPWTLLGIMPTNNALMATEIGAAGPETRELVLKWGSLHAVRTALGFVATGAFLWAALSH
jgi:anthrone oxygenase-like protein